MRNANLLLYLNLAGEVFYIIVHRMKSQKVKEEHQERVRNDIAIAICHTTVIQNLLKGSLQILNLKLADVRILMDRIVHSSIMTVNAFSMEKLFELTLIATKYQYTTCQYPSDILLIALNHLDTIQKTVTDTTAKTLAENLHNLLVDRFKDVDVRTMQTYRYLILSYLADVKLKMTNLIRLGLQKTSGEFVKQFPDKIKRPEMHPPGLIEVFKCADQDEHCETVSCTCGCEAQCECDEFDSVETLEHITAGDKHPTQIHESASRGSEVLTTRFKMEDPEAESLPVFRSSLALKGDRGIPLGLSIYDIPGNCDDAATKSESESGLDESGAAEESAITAVGEKVAGQDNDTDRYYFLANSDFYATKGLDLCSVLLGCNDKSEGASKETDPQSASGSATATNQTVSASALGLESVLDNFPSLGFGGGCCTSGHQSDQDKLLNMNPSSINVVKFDARKESTGNKAALAAIAQDFFDLEAEEKTESSGRKYKTAMDELLGDFDFSDE